MDRHAALRYCRTFLISSARLSSWNLGKYPTYPSAAGTFRQGTHVSRLQTVANNLVIGCGNPPILEHLQPMAAVRGRLLPAGSASSPVYHSAYSCHPNRVVTDGCQLQLWSKR